MFEGLFVGEASVSGIRGGEKNIDFLISRAFLIERVSQEGYDVDFTSITMYLKLQRKSVLINVAQGLRNARLP